MFEVIGDPDEHWWEMMLEREDGVIKTESVPSGTLEVRSAGTEEPVVTIHGALIADVFLPLFEDASLRRRFRRFSAAENHPG